MKKQFGIGEKSLLFALMMSTIYLYGAPPLIHNGATPPQSMHEISTPVRNGNSSFKETILRSGSKTEAFLNLNGVLEPTVIVCEKNSQQPRVPCFILYNNSKRPTVLSLIVDGRKWAGSEQGDDELPVSVENVKKLNKILMELRENGLCMREE